MTGGGKAFIESGRAALTETSSQTSDGSLLVKLMNLWGSCERQLRRRGGAKSAPDERRERERKREGDTNREKRART